MFERTEYFDHRAYGIKVGHILNRPPLFATPPDMRPLTADELDKRGFHDAAASKRWETETYDRWCGYGCRGKQPSRI